MPPPQLRIAENGRHDLLPAGRALLDDDVAGQRQAVEERLPDRPAPDRERQRDQQRRRRAIAPPIARQLRGDEQQQRQDQRELRLVDQAAEQQPGDERPLVEQHQPAAEQERGQEAVVAVGQADQGDRRGERRAAQSLAAAAAATRRVIIQANGARVASLPDDQRRHIGHGRERGGDQQERRRIMPAIKVDVGLVVNRLLDSANAAASSRPRRRGRRAPSCPRSRPCEKSVPSGRPDGSSVPCETAISAGEDGERDEARDGGDRAPPARGRANRRLPVVPRVPRLDPE